MKVFALLSSIVLFTACGDDTATGGNGGSGGQPSSGGAPTDGGNGGAPSDGGSGEGGAGGDPGPMKRVFVTSTTFDGNLGGLAGGDAECQALADGAELGGTWMAWLSETAGESPSTRFTQSVDPYVLVGGAQIAADWAALIDGSIDAPIDRDENGAQISDEILVVWTGTTANGTGVSPCCDDWTNTASGGAKGLTSATDATWSFNTGQGCTTLSHLYCFEQ